MKKIHYNKLIRDKIPDKIKRSGAAALYRILNKKEFEKKLICKAEEEASGMQAAKTKAELISEIADVLDVIDEVKKVKKIATSQIKKAQQKNNQKKGGFKKRIYLNWTTDSGYRTNEKTYRK